MALARASELNQIKLVWKSKSWLPTSFLVSKWTCHQCVGCARSRWNCAVQERERERWFENILNVKRIINQTNLATNKHTKQAKLNFHSLDSLPNLANIFPELWSSLKNENIFFILFIIFSAKTTSSSFEKSLNDQHNIALGSLFRRIFVVFLFCCEPDAFDKLTAVAQVHQFACVCVCAKTSCANLRPGKNETPAVALRGNGCCCFFDAF